MTLTATTLRATGILGIVCALLAVATLWLVFTEPVTVATAVQQGNVSVLFDAFATALARVVRSVVYYL